MRHNKHGKKNKSERVFLLYPQHKGFQSGISVLNFETLPTSLKSPYDCLITGVRILFWIVLGCGCLALCANRFGLDQRFMNEAEDISVEVWGCTMKSVSKSASKPRVYFRYSLNDAVHVGEWMLTGPDCDAYPAGTILSASYIPSEPALIRPSQVLALDQELSLYIGLACLLPFILIPILRGLYRLGVYRRARWVHVHLQTNGELVAGTIISVWMSNLEDKGTPMEIRYQFMAPNKKLLLGWATDQSRRQPPPIGTSILVLYADEHTYIML
jgi:hypothetical protein